MPGTFNSGQNPTQDKCVQDTQGQHLWANPSEEALWCVDCIRIIHVKFHGSSMQ